MPENTHAKCYTQIIIHLVILCSRSGNNNNNNIRNSSSGSRFEPQSRPSFGPKRTIIRSFAKWISPTWISCCQFQSRSHSRSHSQFCARPTKRCYSQLSQLGITSVVVVVAAPYDSPEVTIIDANTKLAREANQNVKEEKSSNQNLSGQ